MTNLLMVIDLGIFDPKYEGITPLGNGGGYS
jgi:hypothetical protein